jgi:hypothetical protein
MAVAFVVSPEVERAIELATRQSSVRRPVDERLVMDAILAVEMRSCTSWVNPRSPVDAEHALVQRDL